jgi:hypothetical protein
MAPTDEDLHSLGRDSVSNDTDDGTDWENTSGVDADGKTPGAANIGNATVISFLEATQIDTDRINKSRPVFAPQSLPGFSIRDGVLIESQMEQEVLSPSPILSSPSLPSPPAGATLIDFDDLTAPTAFVETVRLTDRYAMLGVIFEGPGGNDGGAILDEGSNFGVSGHSSPNFLCFNNGASLSDGGIPQCPETLHFEPSISSIQALVGAGHSVGQVTIEAFNASNELVDSATITLSSLMTPIAVSGPGIVRVEISTTADTFALDNLTFSPDDCQTTWDVYLGTNPNELELIASDLDETNFCPGWLEICTQYFWKVVAKNPSGETPGPIWSFRTEISGAYCYKKQAINILEDILQQDPAAEEVLQAIVNLYLSLGNNDAAIALADVIESSVFWSDPNRISERQGGYAGADVFEYEQIACTLLDTYIQNRGSAFATEVEEVWQLLAEADKQLAETAISDAVFQGADPVVITDAKIVKSQGDAAKAQGGTQIFEMALPKYAQAWQEATNSLGPDADVNRDGIVDTDDFIIFADRWLDTVTP